MEENTSKTSLVKSGKYGVFLSLLNLMDHSNIGIGEEKREIVFAHSSVSIYSSHFTVFQGNWEKEGEMYKICYYITALKSFSNSKPVS